VFVFTSSPTHLLHAGVSATLAGATAHQLQEQQQQQQQQPTGMWESPDVASLTLARSPLRTLYYFSCSVASGTASAAHFVATHPITLGLALPLLAFYSASKGLGYAEETTALIEVCLQEDSNSSCNGSCMAVLRNTRMHQKGLEPVGTNSQTAAATAVAKYHASRI
jgi:hypothetical protein